jgi:phosphoglycolate phosphatase
MIRMSYKAVLFDLDGTLLDSLTDLADATNYALRRLGFPEYPKESFKHFVGDGASPWNGHQE